MQYLIHGLTPFRRPLSSHLEARIKGYWALLAAFWWPLGDLREPLGGSLGASWGPLTWEPLGGLLGASEKLVGGSAGRNHEK